MHSHSFVYIHLYIYIRDIQKNLGSPAIGVEALPISKANPALTMSGWPRWGVQWENHGKTMGKW